MVPSELSQRKKKDRTNLVSASVRLVVRSISQLDKEVAHELQVGVGLCIADVSRILSDGILDQNQ